MRAMILQAIDNCNRKMGWWAATVILKYIIIVLAFVLYTIVIYRAGGVKASERYEAWKVRYVDDYLTQQEAAKRGMPQDPREVMRENDINLLSQLCYPVQGNSDEDIAKYVWAVFDRVDIKSGEFADVKSIEEVLAKEGQFVGYDPKEEYPVLGRIKRIVSEQYDLWKSGTDRPYDVVYVFIYWTPEKVMLLKEMGDLIHGV